MMNNLTKEQIAENNRRVRLQVLAINEAVGKMPGENCDICKNRGFIAFMKENPFGNKEIKEYVISATICECMSKRPSKKEKED